MFYMYWMTSGKVSLSGRDEDLDHKKYPPGEDV